ncbi:MAG TPA: 23S rRNA (guanosine(2251)-2'-O)-methyltransferase RlmB [Acholeplasmatales bacterium]|nr:23S rRNA (guanosine(2251)-2'-O)-methyltransferase RlmB [Acholeplasmatales bacterium]
MSELIYGFNVVTAAVESGYSLLNVRVTADNLDMIKLLKEKRIPFSLVSKEELNRLVPLCQGIMAEIAEFRTYSLNQVAEPKGSPEAKRSLLIVLDGLEDPHNLGAILRTAEASGSGGIIYPKNRSVKLNSTVAKVSTGSIFNVKCVEVVNIVATLKKLKDLGYWVVGADAFGKVDYNRMKYDFPTVLVIGSEGKGISRLVLEECDLVVRIPMVGKINSLNASVSAGILIYQIKKDQWE